MSDGSCRPVPVYLVRMVTWGDWEYRQVAEDLRLGPLATRPSWWDEGVRTVESTIETLLAFNLEGITGLPLHLLRRSHRIDPTADIIATDPLRRIHLFEVKKRSFSGQSAAQLNQYLLQHVFQDPEEFLVESAEKGKAQVTPLRVARDVVGAWTNNDGPGTGYSKLLEELAEDHPLLRYNGNRLSKYRYRKLDEAEQLRLVYAALAANAEGKGLQVPSLDRANTVAEYWSPRLQTELSLPESQLTAERRLVLWLVGASFSEQALERVRLWRRSGIDARALCVTGRSNGHSWTLRVRRETIPRRDQTEIGLLARANDPSQAPTTVKAVFYDEKSASTHSRHGGEPLDQPIVKIKGEV